MSFHNTAPRNILLGLASLALGITSCGLPPISPREEGFVLGIKPSTIQADGSWSWSYPTVGSQPQMATITAASEDGQRLLIKRDASHQFPSVESLDGGVTWNFGETRPAEVWSPNMHHVVRPQTLEVSHDGGLSWSTLPEGSAGSDWFVSDSGVVARYSIWGQTFSLLPPLQSNWQTLALRPGVALQTLFVASGGELLVNHVEYSDDGGTSWGQFLPAVGTFRLAARVDSDGAISLLEMKKTSQGHAVSLSRSTDQGASWTRTVDLILDDQIRTTWLSSDGQRAVIHFGGHGFAVTWNGGATWVRRLDSYFSEITLWGQGQGLVVERGWVSRTSDGLKSLSHLRLPGNRLHALVVAEDKATVTGIFRTPVGDMAWKTSDGLNWSETDVPAPPAGPSKVKKVWAISPNGLHGVGATRAGSYDGGYDWDSWYAYDIQVFHRGVVKQVAKIVDIQDWEGGEGLTFRGATSDDGSVLSVSITGEYRHDNFISTDAGATWWGSGSVVVLAWSSDGQQGIGLREGLPVTTADKGVSWSALPAGAPYTAEKAVYFHGGMIVLGGRGEVVFGRQQGAE